jgi:hypothetical protein
MVTVSWPIKRLTDVIKSTGAGKLMTIVPFTAGVGKLLSTGSEL